MNCIICSTYLKDQEKNKKNHKLCYKCVKKTKNKFLLFNNNNIYQKTVDFQEAFFLIENFKYKLKNKKSLIESNSNSKKNKFLILKENGIKEISNFEFTFLLDKNYAKKINDFTAEMLFNRKYFLNEIFQNSNKCELCKKETDTAFFYEEYSDFSIINKDVAFTCCSCCMVEFSEKKMFKWLNIKNNDDLNFDYFWNSSKTKKFKINISDLNIFLEENMMHYDKNEKKYLLNYSKTSFRNYIKKRDKNKCHYCDKQGETIDHLFPKSKGGITSPKNCVWSCSNCNFIKADNLYIKN